MDQISRRKFLQIAGGITFLSLVPARKGFFAAPAPAGSSVSELPLFTVIPYIQPGSASKLIETQDTLVVSWQTEAAPANFEVHYGIDKNLDRAAKISVGQRIIGAAGKLPAAASPADSSAFVQAEYVNKRLNYSAQLVGLDLDQRYRYQVIGNGQLIADGFATTRKKRGTPIRFAAFGDNSYGDLSDHMIAFRAYSANPDFIMNTGDNVYDGGLDNEYARNFFPVYNSDSAALHSGAPLLRSVPFYTVMANHDVAGKGGAYIRKKGSSTTTAVGGDDALPPAPDDSVYVLEAYADFDKNRDSLAYYTAMHLPSNGPQHLNYPTPLVGKSADVIEQFVDCAGPRFPAQANYSFDYGDCHFLCLDSNEYVDPTDSSLQSWIEEDLSGTDAPWKIVIFHHPPFNVGYEHYDEQHMRVLAPIFEKSGVDLALHGHEHTYQRTQPIKFAPSSVVNASLTNSKNRQILGTFTVDHNFDGIRKTVPDGIIYVVTGAGGKELYEPDFTNAPENWVHPEDDNVAYVTKFYSRKHSLTIFEVDDKTLHWKQINEVGDIVDEVTVTKA